MPVLFAALYAVWVALLSISPAQSEPFIDLYGGVSNAADTDVSASQQACFLVGCTASNQTTQAVDFRSGFSTGVRGGYWFRGQSWFGLAGDLSYFESTSSQVDLGTISLAATPMARLILFPSQNRANGLLQPYAGIGPTVVFHTVSADFQPASPITLGGWSMGVGWTARTGVAIPISEHIALFSEWRLSQDRVSFHQQGFFGIGEEGRLELTQTAQHYLFGASYRF